MEFMDDRTQPAAAPITTIISGISFRIVGSINIDVLIGGIHDIALPATIDIIDSAVIGITIFLGSSILISSGPE
jgi:hypothetical protein